VVVGGGYIGLEMAEARVLRGLRVALVEAGPQPMRTLDPDMGALVADALRQVGVTVYLGERVEGFAVEAGHVRAVATAARTLPADLVVLGLGARPNSALAEQAGIPVGATGGIRTDRRMRTRVEGVWAAGDCVQTVHLVSGRPVGAQIVGQENAAKRIDALAVAIWNHMTVEEMSGLDLSYAPPFAPVWDPVLIAARKAAERVEQTMAHRG
jgi:NADPH-dependent 2,4-dienoyl-CoA reductase/sulfur reductase-like enzyme